MSSFYMDKDPSAVLWYGIDWSTWLQEGDSIATAIWTVTNGLVNESSLISDNVARIKLSGGVLDSVALATCRITTAVSGEVDDRTLHLRITDR